MALRTIVLDGDPVLTKKCRPVTEFNDRLAQLLDDMAETMLEEDGLGLAAPQVGVLRRVFVALDESEMPDVRRAEAAGQVEREDDPDTHFDEEGEPDAFEEFEEEWDPVVMEFINPEILEVGEPVRGYEGCLSFPGRFGAIQRPTWVKIRAQDRYGNPFEYEARGTMARCLCHESDHLDGVTITDLAEYFYDPQVPRELDVEITGDEPEDGEAPLAEE